MDVRSIIVEALARSNVVPRRQTAPGDRIETGLNLLKGIVSQYNNDNFLNFTQDQLNLPARKYIHIYDKVDTLLDENNKVFNTVAELMAYQLTDAEVEEGLEAMAKDRMSSIFVAEDVGGAPTWVENTAPDEFDPRYQQMKKYIDSYHVAVRDVAKLNTLCVNRGGVYGMFQLNFLPRSEFDAYRNNELYWTWNPMAEGEWFIEVKPYVATNSSKLRLDFNRSIKLELDTDLRIPDAYLELLIVSLTYALAVKFPRLDDTHVERLKKQMDTMLSNVRTPKADAKMVLRNNDYASDIGTYSGVLSGRMFY